MIRLFILLLSLLAISSVWSHEGLHDQTHALTHQMQHTKADATLYLKRGRLYFEQQNYKRAIRDLQKSLKLKPGLHSAHYHLGRVYLAAKRLHGAEHHAQQFITAVGKDKRGALSRGHRLLGEIYKEKGEFVKSAGFYQQGLQYNDDPRPSHFIHVAESYLKAGPAYRPQALSALDAGIARLGPLLTLQEMAIGLELQDQNHAGALRRIDSLKTQGVSSFTLHYRKALALLTAKETQAAKSMLQRALEEITLLPQTRRSTAIVKTRKEIEKQLSTLGN